MADSAVPLQAVKRMVAWMAWVLVACGPPPSSPLAVRCHRVTEELTPPEPWFVASPQFERYASWLEQSVYRAMDQPIDTTIDDLVVFDNRLYVGVGDFNYNTGSRYCHASGGACDQEDAEGHGVPLLRVDRPDSFEAVVAHVLREEEVSNFRRLGRHSLLVAGIDPTEGDGPLACQNPKVDGPRCEDEPTRKGPREAVGSLHRFVDGEWSDNPVFEGALHVFDHTERDGLLFAAGSSKAEDVPGLWATVWRSDDDGASWSPIVRVGGRNPRFTTVLSFPDAIVALGHDPILGTLRWIRVAGEWSEATELAAGVSTAPRAELIQRDLAIVWSRDGTAALLQATPGLGIDTLPLPTPLAGRQVMDVYLTCDGEAVVLTRDPTPLDRLPHRYEVHRYTASTGQVTRLLDWSSDVRVASLASWRGRIVFGAEGGLLLQSQRR